MFVGRARLYDILALLTAVIVVVLDQWTKALVVENVPLFGQVPLPLVGKYLVLEHIRNSGAAFSMFNKDGGSTFLTILIIVAILVVGYLYARMLNSGPLAYKLIFGLIIGGAVGNLIDRAIHNGYVVDFISFRIPEINFYFAIFNVADACISVGVVLLFLFMLFHGNSEKKMDGDLQKELKAMQDQTQTSAVNTSTVGTTERDAQP